MKRYLFVLGFFLLHVYPVFSFTDKNIDSKKTLISQFGQIHAKSIDFPDCFDKKNLSTILFDDVALFLQTGATIKSDFGMFDLDQQKLILSSAKDVVFCDQTTLLDLTAGQIECNIHAIPFKESFSSMTFSNHVHGIFDKKIHFRGGKAHYYISDAHRKISCYPEKNDVCKFRMNGHPIHAQFAEVDLDTKSCYLQKIDGHMRHFPFAFSSNELRWDKETNTFHLQGEVVIDHTSYGQIQAEKVDLLSHENTFSKIIAQGQTQMQFISTNIPATYLQCLGTITVDNEKLQMRAMAQNSDTPLCFYDDQVTIYANEALCIYSNEHQHITPQMLSLFNNIRFIYRQTPNLVGYGIADTISYDPKTKTIILKAAANKKVLFWQDDDALHISADEIHMTQNNQIQGKGDVRFSFNLEEEEFFQQIFSKYLLSHE